MIVPALAASLGLALAPAAGAQTPAQDSVTGTGANCVQVGTCPPGVTADYWSLTVDASSGPSGGDPAGTVTWYQRYLGGGTRGAVDVTCLSVSGDVAIIGIAGTRTFFGVFGEIPQPIAGLIRVTDKGGPASSLDRFELHLTEPPDPADCSSFPAGEEVLRNADGDFAVHDAPSVPGAVSQCENGGWQAFGTFAGEAACIAAARHQARQECIFIRAAHGVAAFRAWYGTPVTRRHAMRRCVGQRSSA
jgi:hypothetical protein